VGHEFVVDNPCGELVPFVNGLAVDGDSPFYHLVLARLKIRYDLLGDLRKISTVDEVVSLQEDGSEPRFSNGVVLEIELVESVE
jgi:hypothetical protein